MTAPSVEEQPKEKDWMRKRMKKEKEGWEEGGCSYQVRAPEHLAGFPRSLS